MSSDDYDLSDLAKKYEEEHGDQLEKEVTELLGRIASSVLRTMKRGAPRVNGKLDEQKADVALLRATALLLEGTAVGLYPNVVTPPASAQAEPQRQGNRPNDERGQRPQGDRYPDRRQPRQGDDREGYGRQQRQGDRRDNRRSPQGRGDRPSDWRPRPGYPQQPAAETEESLWEEPPSDYELREEPGPAGYPQHDQWNDDDRPRGLNVQSPGPGVRAAQPDASQTGSAPKPDTMVSRLRDMGRRRPGGGRL